MDLSVLKFIAMGLAIGFGVVGPVLVLDLQQKQLLNQLLANLKLKVKFQNISILAQV